MKKIILFLVLVTGLFAQGGGMGQIAITNPTPTTGPGSGDVVGPASSTNNAFARFSGTTGKLLQDSPDLTYVSPTLSVPDAFVVSSAGSIGLTAGGSNKNVTITPSGTGKFLIPIGTNTIQVVGGASAVTPGIALASGTTGKALSLEAGNSGCAFEFDSSGFFNITYNSRANILSNPTGGTVAMRIDGSNGLVTLSAGLVTGGAGNMTITAGTGNSRTLTLQTTTSGGTATNAVVFSATQSATFNGPIIQKSSALTYASPTSVDVTLGNVYTVTTVNATGSVTFNASAGGTAGQSMTILITNDATSAKTITFGTNFLSTGTLTASAASRHTSITFTSDGTNWYETGRAVLTN